MDNNCLVVAALEHCRPKSPPDVITESRFLYEYVPDAARTHLTSIDMADVRHSVSRVPRVSLTGLKPGLSKALYYPSGWVTDVAPLPIPDATLATLLEALDQPHPPLLTSLVDTLAASDTAPVLSPGSFRMTVADVSILVRIDDTRVHLFNVGDGAPVAVGTQELLVHGHVSAPRTRRTNAVLVLFLWLLSDVSIELLNTELRVDQFHTTDHPTVSGSGHIHNMLVYLGYAIGDRELREKIIVGARMALLTHLDRDVEVLTEQHRALADACVGATGAPIVNADPMDLGQMLTQTGALLQLTPLRKRVIDRYMASMTNHRRFVPFMGLRRGDSSIPLNSWQGVVERRLVLDKIVPENTEIIAFLDRTTRYASHYKKDRAGLYVFIAIYARLKQEFASETVVDPWAYLPRLVTLLLVSADMKLSASFSTLKHSVKLLGFLVLLRINTLAFRTGAPCLWRPGPAVVVPTHLRRQFENVVEQIPGAVRVLAHYVTLLDLHMDVQRPMHALPQSPDLLARMMAPGTSTTLDLAPTLIACLQSSTDMVLSYGLLTTMMFHQVTVAGVAWFPIKIAAAGADTPASTLALSMQKAFSLHSQELMLCSSSAVVKVRPLRLAAPVSQYCNTVNGGVGAVITPSVFQSSHMLGPDSPRIVTSPAPEETEGERVRMAQDWEDMMDRMHIDDENIFVAPPAHVGSVANPLIVLGDHRQSPTLVGPVVTGLPADWFRTTNILRFYYYAIEALKCGQAPHRVEMQRLKARGRSGRRILDMLDLLLTPFDEVGTRFDDIYRCLDAGSDDSFLVAIERYGVQVFLARLTSDKWRKTLLDVYANEGHDGIEAELHGLEGLVRIRTAANGLSEVVWRDRTTILAIKNQQYVDTLVLGTGPAPSTAAFRSYRGFGQVFGAPVPPLRPTESVWLYLPVSVLPGSLGMHFRAVKRDEYQSTNFDLTPIPGAPVQGGARHLVYDPVKNTISAVWQRLGERLQLTIGDNATNEWIGRLSKNVDLGGSVNYLLSVIIESANHQNVLGHDSLVWVGDNRCVVEFPGMLGPDGRCVTFDVDETAVLINERYRLITRPKPSVGIWVCDMDKVMPVMDTQRHGAECLFVMDWGLPSVYLGRKNGLTYGRTIEPPVCAGKRIARAYCLRMSYHLLGLDLGPRDIPGALVYMHWCVTVSNHTALQRIIDRVISLYVRQSEWGYDAIDNLEFNNPFNAWFRGRALHTIVLDTPDTTTSVPIANDHMFAIINTKTTQPSRVELETEAEQKVADETDTTAFDDPSSPGRQAGYRPLLDLHAFVERLPDHAANEADTPLVRAVFDPEIAKTMRLAARRCARILPGSFGGGAVPVGPVNVEPFATCVDVQDRVTFRSSGSRFDTTSTWTVSDTTMRLVAGNTYYDSRGAPEQKKTEDGAIDLPVLDMDLGDDAREVPVGRVVPIGSDGARALYTVIQNTTTYASGDTVLDAEAEVAYVWSAGRWVAVAAVATPVPTLRPREPAHWHLSLDGVLSLGDTFPRVVAVCDGLTVVLTLDTSQSIALGRHTREQQHCVKVTARPTIEAQISTAAGTGAGSKRREREAKARLTANSPQTRRATLLDQIFTASVSTNLFGADLAYEQTGVLAELLTLHRWEEFETKITEVVRNGSLPADLLAVHRSTRWVTDAYTGPREAAVAAFEFSFGSFLTNRQHTVLNQLLARINHAEPFSVQNVLMGYGKTSVILPCLASVLGAQHPRVVVIVPTHMVTHTFDALTRCALSRPVVMLADITREQWRLASTVLSSDAIIILSDTTWKVCDLLGSQYPSLGVIMTSIRAQTPVIIDEFDTLYNPTTSTLTFPLQRSTAGLPVQLLRAVAMHMMEYAGFNEAEMVKEYYVLLSKNKQKKSKKTKKSSELKWLSMLLSTGTSTTPVEVLAQSFMATIKGVADMQLNRHFGFSRERPDHLLAIPYAAHGVPAEGSDFREADVAVVLTLRCHCESKTVMPGHLLIVIRHIYEAVFSSNLGIADAFALYMIKTKLALPSLDTLREVVDTGHTHAYLERLSKTLSRDKAAWSRFMGAFFAYVIFPEFHFDQLSLNTSFVESIHDIAHKVAFSGTTNLPLLQYPGPTDVHTVHVDPREQAHIVASILGAGRVIPVDHSVARMMQFAHMLRNRRYSALIDCAGLMVQLSIPEVAALLGRYTSGRAIVYVVDGIRLVRMPTGPVVEYTPSLHDELDAFFYFDESSTIGVDVSMPADAVALVSFDKHTRWTRLAQAVFRMRDVGRGQHVDIWNLDAPVTNALQVVHHAMRQEVAHSVARRLPFAVQEYMLRARLARSGPAKYLVAAFQYFRYIKSLPRVLGVGRAGHMVHFMESSGPVDVDMFALLKTLAAGETSTLHQQSQRSTASAHAHQVILDRHAETTRRRQLLVRSIRHDPPLFESTSKNHYLADYRDITALDTRVPAPLAKSLGLHFSPMYDFCGPILNRSYRYFAAGGRSRLYRDTSADALSHRRSLLARSDMWVYRGTGSKLLVVTAAEAAVMRQHGLVVKKVTTDAPVPESQQERFLWFLLGRALPPVMRPNILRLLIADGFQLLDIVERVQCEYGFAIIPYRTVALLRTGVAIDHSLTDDDMKRLIFGSTTTRLPLTDAIRAAFGGGTTSKRKRGDTIDEVTTSPAKKR